MSKSTILVMLLSCLVISRIIAERLLATHSRVAKIQSIILSGPKESPVQGEVHANEEAAKKEGEKVDKEVEKVEEVSKKVAEVAGEAKEPKTKEEKTYVAKEELKNAKERLMRAQKIIEQAGPELREAAEAAKSKNPEKAEKLLGAVKAKLLIAETAKDEADSQAKKAEALGASAPEH